VVVGFDATDDAVAAVEACRMGATVAQLPAQLGRQAIEAAADIASEGAPEQTENIAVALELVINPDCE
jgi:ribose transport system substrate-binding protein